MIQFCYKKDKLVHHILLKYFSHKAMKQYLDHILLVDNKLMNRLNLNESEQKELSNAYYKIRKMLIKNGYFIME